MIQRISVGTCFNIIAIRDFHLRTWNQIQSFNRQRQVFHEHLLRYIGHRLHKTHNYPTEPKGWTGARRGTADVLVSGDSLRAQRNENLSLNMSMMNLKRVG